MVWVVGAVALALGAAAGWWVAAEISRGMPWGFFVLALVVAVGGVAVPVLWPGLLGPLPSAGLGAFAGGLVLSAMTEVSLRMESTGAPEDPRQD